ncbi:MAG: glycosyl transferase family 2, partial [Candidatus Sumerlaeota bacterium]|nr:glycosyl transferase family 2 [Candidatus Sumerlaeota bacterium]
VDINGFKNQQHRWTKGAIQTGVKLLGPIWRSSVPLRIKLEATVHLTNNLAYLLMLLLSFLMLPALDIRHRYGLLHWFLWDTPLLALATVSVGAFYACSQREIGRGAWRVLLYLPALMGVGIGLCVNNSRAVLEGLFGHSGEFVRTEKYRIEGRKGAWMKMKYSPRRNALIPFIEIGLGLYFTFIVIHEARLGLYASMPFMIIFQIGYLYVGTLSLLQRPLEALFAARSAPSASAS